MEIWDAHCHLNGVPGATPEARLEHLLRYADRMEIARLCICMGMDFCQDPTPERMRQDNDDVLRALNAHPDRAFGFVYLNPRYPEASLEELKRCVGDGPMVGVKLWVAMRCTAPELDPIVARAAALCAPVFQHTWLKAAGNLPGESTPADLAELAGRHPESRLSCGHTGVDWEAGLQAIRHSPNVYSDLSGSDPTAGFAEAAVAMLGADRVLFGTDAGGRGFASQLAKIHGADLPEQDRALILGGNLRRLLAPILATKGVTV